MSETSAPSKRETDQVFHCRTCASLRPEEGRLFCEWLGSFLGRSALDGFCEGYKPKEPDAKQQGGNDKLVDNQVSQVPYPKTDSASALKRPEKTMILKALELKKLGGRVYWEKVCCRKRNCHCQSRVKADLHGPYRYLHYVSQGKWKKKYLRKGVSELLSLSEEKLAAILGQERRSSETFGVV